MGAGVAFPAAVVVACAAVFLAGAASASWHAQVFEVGGARGWEKPAAPTGESYDHWAARNRFHVGDFLRKRSNIDRTHISHSATALIRSDPYVSARCLMQTSSTT